MNKKYTVCSGEFPDWVIQDLLKSGLTPDTFHIEPLQDEAELKERLRLTRIGDTSIMSVGGYWIPYPNIPEYYRLKLRRTVETPDGKMKYVSPVKEIGKGNHAYILPEVAETANNYSPDKPLYVVEGEKKGVALTLAGFPAIALPGVWLSDEGGDFPELNQIVWTDRTAFIIFDSDIVRKHGVSHAELRLAVNLMNRGARVVRSIRLPDEPDGEKNGADDYLERHGREALQELVQGAKPTLELQVEEGIVTRPIFSELHKLNNDIEREKILKLLARREGVSVEAVKKEYNKCAPKQEESKKPDTETYTPEEIEKAKELLKSPKILERMHDLTTRRGYVGEDVNKTVIFLSFVSRLLRSSISVIVKGVSSSGKSSLVNCVLNLIPKDHALSFSFLTGKALVHFSGDLSHKILFIQEHSGSQAADYSIRTTLSEGELSIALPVKDETTGNFTTIEKRIPAVGLVFVETTTKERVYAENQTRVFDLFMNESREQTENVLRAEAERDDTLDPGLEQEAKTWRAAQTILKSHDVVIPFAKKLVEAFPTGKVRARRDFPRFLSLIRSHCLLYQFQRVRDSKGRLIATVDDLKGILSTTDIVLAQSLKECSPNQEKILEKIKINFTGKELSLKELDRFTKEIVSYRTLQRYTDGFIKDGLLEWNGKPGKESRYTLLNPDDVMSSKSTFTDKILEILENISRIHDKTDLSSNDVMSSKEADSRHDDNSRQNAFAVKKVNNNGKLTPEKPIHDMTTKDTDGRDDRIKDEDSWEREATEFLKKAENAQ